MCCWLPWTAGRRRAAPWDRSRHCPALSASSPASRPPPPPDWLIVQPIHVHIVIVRGPCPCTNSFDGQPGLPCPVPSCLPAPARPMFRLLASCRQCSITPLHCHHSSGALFRGLYFAICSLMGRLTRPAPVLSFAFNPRPSSQPLPCSWHPVLNSRRARILTLHFRPCMATCSLDVGSSFAISPAAGPFIACCAPQMPQQRFHRPEPAHS